MTELLSWSGTQHLTSRTFSEREREREREREGGGLCMCTRVCVRAGGGGRGGGSWKHSPTFFYYNYCEISFLLQI